MTKASGKKPFAHHLAELRTRLFFIVGVFLLGSIIGYYVATPLLTLILLPLHQAVYYTSPIGGFNVILTVSILIGFLLAIPMTLYQTFLFTKPLLSQKIIKRTPFLLLTSFFLVLLGVAFAYFIALPASLHFFSQFGSTEVKSLINANDYLSFVMKYFLGFGLLFQLPLILGIVNAVHPISVRTLFSYQRYVIVVAFLIGAILSPDPFNMMLMAGPILILFYISIAIIGLSNSKVITWIKKPFWKRRRKKKKHS